MESREIGPQEPELCLFFFNFPELSSLTPNLHTSQQNKTLADNETYHPKMACCFSSLVTWICCLRISIIILSCLLKYFSQNILHSPREEPWQLQISVFSYISSNVLLPGVILSALLGWHPPIKLSYWPSPLSLSAHDPSSSCSISRRILQQLPIWSPFQYGIVLLSTTCHSYTKHNLVSILQPE